MTELSWFLSEEVTLHPGDQAYGEFIMAFRKQLQGHSITGEVTRTTESISESIEAQVLAGRAYLVNDASAECKGFVLRTAARSLADAVAREMVLGGQFQWGNGGEVTLRRAEAPPSTRAFDVIIHGVVLDAARG